MPAAIAKKALKDSTLKALQKTPPSGRTVVWDSLMPNFAVRVTDKGSISFYAVKRRAGDASPTWHRLGGYPATSLAEARDAAREVLVALDRGESPREQAASRTRATRAAEDEARENTFRAIGERYMKHLTTGDQPPRPSTVRAYQGYLDRHLIQTLGDRPVKEISRRDVIAALDKVRESAGVASTIGAKSLLGAILTWAADREIIAANPAAGVKVKAIVGRVARARDRALSDDEMAAVWSAAPAVGEPFASLFRLLMLTGCRLNEIAGAKWDEVADGVLTIPAERSKNGLAMLVPLPARAAEIVEAMPRFSGGDYIFTTTHGRRPVSAFSHAKGRLDAAIAKSGDKVADFVVHDFRRTFRSGLARLGVPTEVAEACLNHKPAGIVGTYNVHSYRDEKGDALRRWQDHVLSVVEPTPEPAAGGGKVVRMMRKRA